MKHWVVLAALTLLPLPALAADTPPPAGLQVGQPAPAFDLPTIDGKRISLAALRGKTVVLNAWATWCPPCREETPDMLAAHKQLASKDVVFVGIDSTEGAALVKAFVASKGISWIQAIDADRAFSRAYDIRYFPTTWVIDPQGILREQYVDVVTPALLAGFVADAKTGRNGTIASPLQSKIDALLALGQYPFSGDEATVVANALKARKAIDEADKMVDDSEPAKGNPIDLVRTQAEENALRTAAIAALEPLATTDERKLALALLQGDAEGYLGHYDEALAAYRRAAQLDPKNTDALDGISQSARRLKDYDAMLAADEALVGLQPESVDALVDLGVDAGTAGKFDRGREAFERAIALQSVKANSPDAKPVAIRKLAWAHMYYGRMEAKAKETERARRQFALAGETALKLPKNDIRYAIYLEQAQEETVALTLDGGEGKSLKTALSLAPWTGPELPGSVVNTFKYRLVVAGTAGKTVALHASDLPKGWIASFCTDRICAPLHVSTTLPASGVKVIEFQVVPPAAKPAHAPNVQVVADDGTSTAVVHTIAAR